MDLRSFDFENLFAGTGHHCEHFFTQFVRLVAQVFPVVETDREAVGCWDVAATVVGPRIVGFHPCDSRTLIEISFFFDGFGEANQPLGRMGVEDKRCFAAFDRVVITDKTSSDRNASVDNFLCLPEPLSTD